MGVLKFDNFINESINDPYDIVKTIYSKCKPYIEEYSRAFTNKSFVGTPPMLYSGRNHSESMFIGEIRKGRAPKDTPIFLHNYVDDVFYDIFNVRARSNALFCTGQYATAEGYGSDVYAIFPVSSYSIIWSANIDDMYSDLLDNKEFDLVGEGLDEVLSRTTNKGKSDIFSFSDMGDTVSDYIDTNKIGKEINSYLRNEFKKDNKKSNYKDNIEYELAIERYVDEHFQNHFEERVQEEIEKVQDKQETNLYDIINAEYEKGSLRDAIRSGNEIMLNCKKYIAVLYEYTPYIHHYILNNKSKYPKSKESFYHDMKDLDINKYRKIRKDVSKHISSYINKDLLDIMNDISKQVKI